MFYDRFIKLCQDRNIAPTRAAIEAGLSKSTVTKWKNSPDSQLSGTVIAKLSDYFGITKAELLGEPEKDQKETPTLTAKDERDIARDLERIRQALESEDTIMFDGDPMSDEARDSIMNAIELGLKAAKIKNKEKYTPKKYRKG